MAKISFFYADRRFNYVGKKLLKAFISQIFIAEAKLLQSLQYIFCSDEYLLGINRQFLNHDDYTDIITFDLSESTSTQGEIYISIDRVKENAQQLQVSFEDELVRVVFHGALHLCSYKDKKKREIETIRNLESHYMRLYKQTISKQ